jgi:hypothetical protein
MADPDNGHEPGLDSRLRTSLTVVAPPQDSNGVLQEVRRRVVRRRRRVREAIGGALVVLVGAGTAAGLALSASPQMTAQPPLHATTVTPNTTAPTRSPSTAPGSGSPASPALSAAPGTPAPCPVGQNTPSMATGSFCGPTPGPGNGLGPSGTCTGRETVAPCGSGVVPGQFYSYTVPGTCSGLMTFDGKRWVSELPPPNPVPAFDVWIQLSANGSVRWIAPTGSVGLVPYTGQTLAACRG